MSGVERSAPWRWIRPGLILTLSGLAATLLFIESRRFEGFMVDDSLISLRYAERLVQGRGLTWSDGERVEGYSNLLWVLGVGGLHALGVDAIRAARALGFVGSLLGGACLLLLGLRGQRPSWIAGIFPMTALVLAGPVLAWTMGGLEQPLILGLLGLSLLALLPLAEVPNPSVGSLLRAGLPLALLALCRPDGALFAASASAAWLVGRRYRGRALRDTLLIGLLPVLFVVAQTLFRLWYYDAWLPNTALVKLDGEGGRAEEGLLYVMGGLGPLRFLLLCALLSLPAFLLSDDASRRRIFLPFSMFLVWTGYVVTIGGDVFEGRRHLVPSILLLCVLAGEGLRWLAVGSRAGSQHARWLFIEDRLPVFMRRRRLLLGIALLFALALPWTVRRAQALKSPHADNQVKLAEMLPWKVRFEESGTLLRDIFPDQEPLTVVNAAGSVPYFTGWPAIDALGLCDRYIATHPPSVRRTRLIGHALGDGAYILRREPDIVFFGWWEGTVEPSSLSDVQLNEDPAFHEAYRQVTVRRARGGMKAVFWVRLEGLLGPKWRDQALELPVYLLSSPERPAILEEPGDMHIELQAGEILQIEPRLLGGRSAGAGVEAGPTGRVLRGFVSLEAPSPDPGARPRHGG